MGSFLEKTAEHLMNTYANKLSDITIVLPNKRAGLFLRQHFSKLIDKPVWLPEIIGTEELVEQLSEAEIIDNVTQLFELYAIYKDTVTTPETFDEFSKWGQILLHDFNEIDRYLVPAPSLFKHINEARAIEVWNLGEGEITEFQQQYLNFWKQMGELYDRYIRHLKANHLVYQGLAYRIVAEELKANPEQFIKEKITSDKLIFIGFNALNKAEEVLITELKKQNKCEVIFDADEYYMDDDIQESGMFLRRFRKKEVFQPFNRISDKFKSEKKQINIYGVPQNIGQAKYLATLVNEIDAEKDFSDTAVVLADENLLVPVLQSIPEAVKNINVTMGYPLRNTSLNNFFEIYFTTLVNAERFGTNNRLTYHYKDLLKLFQLPFSHILFKKDNCNAIRQQIIRHNWVFINKEKLAWINEKSGFSLVETCTIPFILKQCLVFIEQGKQYYIKGKEDENSLNVELEYLFQYAKLFNQIIALMDKYPFLDNIKGFYSLYHQLLSSHNIDLYGEPLKGMQVLGMLETRNIDFKNIILLSANEGVLPAGKTFNSFIPFDIKMAYELPTHIEKDAVYAYHFYRLVQNAENINIIYNTETSEFGSGEQSRYITQIENELSKFGNISITKKLITYPPIHKKQEDQTIIKTLGIIDRIKERFINGISPTALIAYITCPLDFYYKYVLGVREADEVEENIEHSSFGSYVHESLEKLYQPFVGKNIAENDLKEMLKLVPDTVMAVFSQYYNNKELKTGKNLLTLNVARNYISTFIKNEIAMVKDDSQVLFIKSLEKELKASIVVDGVEVNLKGIADRMDICNNQLRIIDYKTGEVNASDLRIKHIDELQGAKKSKSFQLLMYALMYTKNNPDDHMLLSSGIISFRKLSNGFMPFEMDKNTTIDSDLLNDFENLLTDTVRKILDPSQPFTHDPEARWCEFCN